MRKLIFLLAFVLPMLVFGQCPPEGKYKNEKDKQSNLLKNRPLNWGTLDTTVTLDHILDAGNDTARFSSKQFVFITGYVVLVKEGDAEACNCNSKRKEDHDYHIQIGKTPDAKKEETMVVEITPKYMVAHPKFDPKSILGKKVVITGWMFNDVEHKQNAKNTCVKCTLVWRATTWEIHPVVDIAVQH